MIFRFSNLIFDFRFSIYDFRFMIFDFLFSIFNYPDLECLMHVIFIAVSGIFGHGRYEIQSAMIHIHATTFRIQVRILQNENWNLIIM